MSHALGSVGFAYNSSSHRQRTTNRVRGKPDGSVVWNLVLSVPKEQLSGDGKQEKQVVGQVEALLSQ
jgi:hypothetical protein